MMMMMMMIKGDGAAAAARGRSSMPTHTYLVHAALEIGLGQVLAG